VIVCDTGPLVAAAIKDDVRHRDCVDLFTALHLAGRRILVPDPVVAEVGYLLARAGGARVEAQFLTSLAERTLWPVELTSEDYRRSAELVLSYKDLP
jgi:predicted nucleic acid-binding protein